MMMRRTTAVLAAGAAMALTVSACSSSLSDPKAGDSKTSVAEQTKQSNLADKLPAKIKAAGKIVIGTDASYKPNEYFAADGKTIQGMDVDLFTAVMQKFGVKTEFQNAAFDSIILGVQSGKFDVGVSSFTINDERKKVVDFVSYYKAGTLWAVGKGNPKKVDPNNACGQNVGVQTGTVQVTDLQDRSKKCTAAGKPAINILQQDEQSKITLDLTSGKIAAMAADSPVVVSAVLESDGALEQVGDMYDAAPYGYALPKGQDEFAKAIAQALTELEKSGDYDKILTNWKSKDGAITNFAVNPPTS